MPKSKRLNLGCGRDKVPGFINVDIDPALKPDLVLDIRNEQLPYDKETICDVWLSHTIEHIEKKCHPFILSEINRVLKMDGSFWLTYPEFSKCVHNYLTNYKGKREFWEQTIFGRQDSKYDYHVCAMHTEFFLKKLRKFGFSHFTVTHEVRESYNTIVHCLKRSGIVSYEEVISEEIYGHKGSDPHARP